MDHQMLIMGMVGVMGIPSEYRILAMGAFMFYPWFMYYIGRFYSWITRRDGWKYLSVGKQKADQGNGFHGNRAFDAICWYLTERKLGSQNRLSCKGTNNRRTTWYELKNLYFMKTEGKEMSLDLPDNDEETFWSSKPQYIPSSSVTIDWKDEKISILWTGNAETPEFELRHSSDLMILKNFLEEITSIHAVCEHYVRKTDKIMVNTWSNDSFKSKPLSVNKTFSNVYLPHKLNANLLSDIARFIDSESFYNEQGIPYKRGYLFYGPPGTGKSSTAFAIAKHLGWNIYKLDTNMFTTETALRAACRMIPSRSVLLWEEIDSQVSNRRDETTTTKKDEDGKTKTIMTGVSKTDWLKMSVGVLMDLLDGYDCFHNTIIIMTTNFKERLAPALIRPGRIDMHFLFDELQLDDIRTTVESFCGEDISNAVGWTQFDVDLSITSAKLINQILTPYRFEPDKITLMLATHQSYCHQQQE